MVIERKFVKDKIREHMIKEYLGDNLSRVGFSHIDIQKTPVGYSIIIYSSKPGLIVGRKGVNIKEIQKTLKDEFDLESPVIDVREVENPELDPQIMAEMIGTQLSRFGSSRFKAVGHKTLDRIMSSGALGAEIIIAGKVPSSRARSWKFYDGYLPKCGSVAVEEVKKGYKMVKLKSGIVGVTVRILPKGFRMPDQIYLKEEKPTVKAKELTEKEAEENIKEVEKAEKKTKTAKGKKAKSKKKPKKEDSEKKPKKEAEEKKETSKEEKQDASKEEKQETPKKEKQDASKETEKTEDKNE